MFSVTSVCQSVDGEDPHVTTIYDVIGQSQPPYHMDTWNTTPPKHIDLFKLVHLPPPVMYTYT